MRILLISCYELGHQPFNLASPAAHLLSAGFEVNCMDLAIEPLNEKLVREADFVAFSTPMHTALRLSKHAAKRVRELTSHCHICFYGLYAPLHSEYLLNRTNGVTCADSIVGGEFEGPLMELVRSLANGDNQNLKGVVTAEHSGGTFFPRQKFMIPARHLLPPLERYAHLQIGDDLSPVGYVEASRGCAHRCLHCPITPVYKGRMRIIPKEVVLSDIEQLVDMGAEHITFGDPDFLNGVKHSVSILKAMHESFPDLTFDFTAKIEHVLEYRQLFSEFRELGCLFMVSAVELLNDTILRYLHKGHTRADVEEAVRITREAGIYMRPSLMPFTPWTALKDFLDIFAFVEEFEIYDQIDPVQYSIRLLVPPGSSILSIPEIKPYINKFNKESLIYEWQHPDPEMDELQIQISELVEDASISQENNFETYLRIRDLACSFAGRAETYPEVTHNNRKQFTPRLTEDWFC